VIEIDIKDEVTGLVKDVEEAFESRRINPQIGTAMVRLFQDHFRTLPASQSGFPSQHYWGEAAKSMSFVVTADGVKLSSSLPGLNMHVTGIPAIIRPINAKNLAIPARAEAYGRRPREFANLRVAFRKVGGHLEAFALVEGAGEQRGKPQHALQIKGIKGDKKVGQAWTGAVVYWLKKEVHTHRYPGVIPTEEQMRQEAIRIAQQQVDQVKARNARH